MKQNQPIRKLNNIFREYKAIKEIIDQTVEFTRTTRAMRISNENKIEILRVENELLQFSNELKRELANKLRELSTRI